MLMPVAYVLGIRRQLLVTCLTVLYAAVLLCAAFMHKFIFEQIKWMNESEFLALVGIFGLLTPSLIR